MRAALVLASVTLLTLITMVSSVFLAAGSGSQFQRRLRREWTLGRLRLDEPRSFAVADEAWGYDPRRAGFGRALVTNHRSRKVLLLEDVIWHRVRLFPRESGVEFEKAEVRFSNGQLHLDVREGSAWNFAPLFERAPADWRARVPERVSGRALEIHARRKSSYRSAELRAEILEPVFDRDEGVLSFRGRVASPDDPPVWNHGQLEWVSEQPGRWRWSLSIDDAELARFPFESLRRLFEFPSPVGSGFQGGTGSLRWQQSPNAVSVGVEFFRARLSLTGLSHPATMLRGSVERDAEGQRWRFAHGLYSRSLLEGSWTVRPEGVGRERTTGNVVLRQFVDDRELARDLPPEWFDFLGHFPCRGNGAISIEFDGLLPSRPVDLVRSLSIELDGVMARGDRDEIGLTGTFSVKPPEEGVGWEISGETVESSVRGFRLPPSRWRGRATRDRFELRRASSEEDPLRAEIVIRRLADEGGGFGFRIDLSDVPLALFLDRSLGEQARGETFYLEGTWSPETGVVADGYMSWRGVVLPPGVEWGGREPDGPLRGFIRFRIRRGQVAIPAVQALDRVGSWIAQGHVRNDGFWDLVGTVAEGTDNLFIDSIYRRIAAARDLFHLEGPLLRW